MHNLSKKQLYTGAALAIIAALIWAGNFIVAKGVANEVPPVTLAFLRWATASIIILPLSIGKIIKEIPIIRSNFKLLFFAALTGVGLFNTFIYIASHYTSAINMALIGTTSTPVFVITLSAIFFKEKIKRIRIAGMLFCIAGIIVLISKGNWETLRAFRFGMGDLWILVSSFSFAIYNILVRRKPAEISPITFLGVVFSVGTLIILPFFLIERSLSPAIEWKTSLFLILLYLGLGTSVTSFLLWNAAIRKIGAVRTALFGNLIPIFASIEAILILGETLTVAHFISGGLVVIGLMLANSKKANQPNTVLAKA